MRRSMLLALFVLGCGGGAAPEPPPSSTASVTPPPSAPPPVAPAPSVAAPPPSEPPPPTSVVDAPAIDLLHAIASTITTSSAYHDDPSQVAHLVDGDLETAWNSRTDDLVGAWIEITLPPDAVVRELRMTAGFTHVAHERDLFTSNHRVTEVRVSHDGTDVGTFPLLAASRELQAVPVSGGGGTYRITLARLEPGERSDWREACISELRVMGQAPGAAEGTVTPTTGVAAAGVTAPSPPPVPATPAPAQETDAAYFPVRGRGLVRLGASGTVVVHDLPVSDFAVDEAGALFVVQTDGRLISIANGERRPIETPYDEPLCCVALAPDGTPVIASAFGIWRRQRSAWGPQQRMDGERPDFEQEQPQAIAVDGHGSIWARGQHSLFRNIGTLWMREFLPGAGDLHVVALAARGDVAAASTDTTVFVHHPAWRTMEHPLGSAAMREIAIGADGVVVGGAYDGILVIEGDAAPRTLALPGAGIITGVARDAQGRTWVTATSAVVVVGPALDVLARWAVDGVPGAGGAALGVQVTGRGPVLPQ